MFLVYRLRLRRLFSTPSSLGVSPDVPPSTSVSATNQQARRLGGEAKPANATSISCSTEGPSAPPSPNAGAVPQRPAECADGTRAGGASSPPGKAGLFIGSAPMVISTIGMASFLVFLLRVFLKRLLRTSNRKKTRFHACHSRKC